MIIRAPGVEYAQTSVLSMRSRAGVCTVVGSTALASSPGVAHRGPVDPAPFRFLLPEPGAELSEAAEFLRRCQYQRSRHRFLSPARPAQRIQRRSHLR